MEEQGCIRKAIITQLGERMCLVGDETCQYRRRVELNVTTTALKQWIDELDRRALGPLAAARGTQVPGRRRSFR